MKKRPLVPHYPVSRNYKIAGTVSAAALMLGVSHAATVGFNFQANYCSAPSYSGAIVTAAAFGIQPNAWENLSPMDNGYGSCAGPLFYTLSQTIDTTSSAGGLNPLPNGSLNLSWTAATANVSGFAGYGPGFGGNGYHPGEQQVYWGFLRDGVNFGPGSSSGDNNQTGYSIDIVGLKSVFTNTPFVVQLIASADSMQDLTNAFIIDATHSTTQSVAYAKPQVYGNVGDTAWYRAIGGGISTVSGAVDANHVQIIGNRAQHVANPGGFNHGSTISGFIITDKPVVTMSPQPVQCGPHDDVSLRAIAAGVPPLSYQWRKGGAAIANATTTSYAISNIITSGNYDVVVTNLYGSATSKVSNVTVDSLLISPQPFVLDSKPSGTPINGPNFGAVWVASNTDGAGTNRTGVMRFSSSDPDQIILPGDASFDTTNGTIMFWMRSAGTSGSGNQGAMLVDRRTTAGFDIVLLDDNTIFVQVAGSANTVFSGIPAADDQWHHIAVTYDQSDSGAISIYIDGVLTGIGANNLTWTWPTGQEVELGHSHDSYWRSYDGLLDDVRIYSRILSDSEVASVHTSGALIDTSALKVRLNFDAKPVAGVGLSWNASGAILQSATAVTGPFSDISPAAASPYYVLAQPSTRFFRYRRTPASVQSNPFDM